MRVKEGRIQLNTARYRSVPIGLDHAPDVTGHLQAGSVRQ